MSDTDRDRERLNAALEANGDTNVLLRSLLNDGDLETDAVDYHVMEHLRGASTRCVAVDSFLLHAITAFDLNVKSIAGELPVDPPTPEQIVSQEFDEEFRTTFREGYRGSQEHLIEFRERIIARIKARR